MQTSVIKNQFSATKVRQNANGKGGKASKAPNADDAVALGIGNLQPDDMSSTSSILTTHRIIRGEKVRGLEKKKKKWIHLFRPKQDRSDLG